MSFTFVFVQENLLAVGTTRKAALRNARKASEANEYAQPFDPRHHDVRIEEATRGAYADVVANHGFLGRAEFDRGLGKYALPRR